MDRYERAANAIKEFYRYKRTGMPTNFIKEVCRFYDSVKDSELSQSDISFLLFLANEAGVPQYFDLLERIASMPDIDEENISLLILSALIYDNSLVIKGNKLHRYQKEVLSRFVVGKLNRYVLTAPTSFGKTHIVYEIISKMQYRSILLVFPSISLLSENFSKLRERFHDYEIHTLSEEQFNPESQNIFVFTPERYLSFLDKNNDVRFDFSFVDEVYKIDNSFIIDQETTGENERDIAYRLALSYICLTSCDMLLAGPYMTLPSASNAKSFSFGNFANENNFEYLIYNDIEIVEKDFEKIGSCKNYTISGKIIEIGNVRKYKKITNIITALSTPTENTIIYCSRRSSTESYVKEIIADHEVISQIASRYADVNSQTYFEFILHLEQTFGTDWIVINALKHHIGIHHSLIPKYIQKEIISLFNKGILIALFSTTTITEGVNTTAKNIIVTSSKKGSKLLKQFDAKNIAGRAGRFTQHFVGRVISIDKEFLDIMNSDKDLLKHKNYDEHSEKTDVDYQITKDDYLSDEDLQEKHRIENQILENKIPQDVFNAFRIVGPKDKLTLYQKLLKYKHAQYDAIQALSRELARSRAARLNWDGFQLIMDTIRPIAKEDKLIGLIDRKTNSGKYSIITVLLNAFLRDGYMGMVKYYVEEKHKPKDEAIHIVSDCVYNVFKYHLVKYLGLFDVFYKYVMSLFTRRSMEDIAGVGILLQKLEYNALTPNARRLSDFGVPFNIVKYYDNDDSYQLPKRFDAYEQYIDGQIQSLLE
jgi:hypothetical protein